MTQSHPPTLLTLVERALTGPCQVRRGDSVVLGVSGGPDSMALLHALARLRDKLQLSLLAVAVNHGLRPEARDEVELVRSFALRLDVPFQGVDISVQPGENLQSRARDARYSALWAVADALNPGSFLATAHHADDRAETVMLRILRGTSPEGLDVLREREGRLLRPLIRVRKTAVLLHNERHGVPSAEDPSNRARRFLRVRVREEVMPLLRELNPNIVDNLCSLADEAAGGPLGLAREQRKQLRHALENPGPIDLPLGRGLRLLRER